MKFLLILAFFLVSLSTLSQEFTTDYPSVSYSNCGNCKIAKVVVSREKIRLLLEIQTERKGRPSVYFTRWTTLAPSDDPRLIDILRNTDLEIPPVANTDPYYLSLWRKLAEDRKVMQNDFYETGSLVTHLDDAQFDVEYSIKSKENRSFYVWFNFKGLPMGIERISMLEMVKDGWEFIGIEIRNPDTSPKTTWTEDLLRAFWEKNGHSTIEGIYEGAFSENGTPNYRVAVKMEPDGYQIIYLSGADNAIWQVGHVKAVMENTATTNLFKADWFMANKDRSNAYITFTGGKMDVAWTDQDGSSQMYIKLYPANSNNIDYNSSVSSSGTGFAVTSDGIIATNYHVIANAKAIKVTGIDGDFSRKYDAKVMAEDRNNDIALLKITDAITLKRPIPYTFGFRLSDVGSDISVLGYPLRASMGDEIKLTNGIVSSKTGFQGDVTAYQLSAAVQPGNSGGPVIDEAGNIIGIINAKHSGAENASYAIKASYLLNLLELSSIQLPSVNLIGDKPLTEQVKSIKDFVYIVEVQ